MGRRNITAEDMYLLKQSTKELYSKVELLNEDFKIVDQLVGNLISDDLSVDSTSSVRRTYNCNLFVTDSTFELARNTKIWINRIIRPYIGIKNIKTDQIVWYLMGTYKIGSTSVSYDATTHTLNLSCNDLMCTLDAEYSGCVEGYSFKIPAGEDARTSIIGLLKDAKVAKYNVGLINKEIPYDLKFDYGASYYDMLSKILELWEEGWQMYFDIDGTFVWEPLPIAFEDDIVLDSNTMRYLLIQENRDDNLSRVYNKTIVYGKMLEPTYYSGEVTYENNVYSAKVETYNADTWIETKSYKKYDVVHYVVKDEDTVFMAIQDVPANTEPTNTAYWSVVQKQDSYVEYRKGDLVGLKLSAENTGDETYININGLGNIIVTDDNGKNIPAKTFKADEVYIFRYRKAYPNNTNNFYLLGQYLPYGEYTEKSKDVFYSTTNVGKVLLQEIQLDSIYSDDLANQRAAYETYMSCRRRDTVSLKMMCVYWLDVNQKVSYQPIDSDEVHQYLIQSITLNSTDGTMTVTLQRFYDDYTTFYKKMNQDAGIQIGGDTGDGGDDGDDDSGGAGSIEDWKDQDKDDNIPDIEPDPDEPTDEANNLSIKTFTNTETFTIKGNAVKVCSVNFQSTKDTIIVVVASIPLEIDCDGVVNVSYYIDTKKSNSIPFDQYYDKGSHILTLTYNVEVPKDTTASFNIYLGTSYYESDCRKQNAQLAGLIKYAKSGGSYSQGTIDTTVPTIKIPDMGIRATIFANDLSKEEFRYWDGTITVKEKIPEFKLYTQKVTAMSDDVECKIKAPVGGEFADAIGEFSITPLGIIGITDAVDAGFPKVLSSSINIENKYLLNYDPTVVLIDGNNFRLNNKYGFSGHQGTIDSGAIVEIPMDFTEFTNVSEVVIK